MRLLRKQVSLSSDAPMPAYQNLSKRNMCVSLKIRAVIGIIGGLKPRETGY
jgi:hypothetical protein